MDERGRGSLLDNEKDLSNLAEMDDAEFESLMASHLPSRKVVHGKKRRKAEKRDRKFRIPVIKILAVLFLLLPVLVAAFLYYQELKNSPRPADAGTPGFDQIEIEKTGEE
jgi:hypothetical protein